MPLLPNLFLSKNFLRFMKIRYQQVTVIILVVQRKGFPTSEKPSLWR